MSYINKSLSTNEEVKEIFKLHWFTMIPVIIFAILAIPTAGLTLIISIYLWLKLKTTEQGVTSKRVVHKTGIISRTTDEMRNNAIETVEINQSILGRIFGFGNVIVTGRGISDVIFKSIDNPLEVKKSIENYCFGD